NAVEAASKAKGIKVPMIDGYRNSRMTEKLALAEKMPALVELSKGAVTKVTTVASGADVEKAL
nr:thioredoxin-disulfide reductase [Fretibacterium sp.]